jgi:protein SCO1/2
MSRLFRPPLTLCLPLLLCASLPAFAHGPHCHPGQADASKSAVHPARFLTSRHTYTLPNLTLVDQDGRRVAVSEVLDGAGPVAVNFIFTSCTTVCPVLSATFAALDGKQEGGAPIRRVSISIDPEHDRPAVLKAYAAQFHAAPGWRFYTGDADDIRKLLAALDVYTGDKSNHRPVTLLREGRASSWVRIDGFTTAAQLVSAFHAGEPVAENR